MPSTEEQSLSPLAVTIETIERAVREGHVSSDQVRRLEAIVARLREQAAGEAQETLAAPLSFADAKEALRETLDLEKLREEALRAHLQWGLVKALIERGIVQTPDEYGALFDKVTLSERAVQGLKARKLDHQGRNPLLSLLHPSILRDSLPKISGIPLL